MILSPLYKGSVKDVLGPYECQGRSAVVFRYSDAYSVFDWGRMPDTIPDKGKALAMTGAGVFERLQDPRTWQAFSRSPVAHALRKDVPAGLGGAFNAIGERLQQRGLKTHYLGVIAGGAYTAPEMTEANARPTSEIAVAHVQVVRPRTVVTAGRELYDYAETRQALPPKLIPLEVVFRFGLPRGSSLLQRFEKDPGVLTNLLIPRPPLPADGQWEFPAVEFFTKLETTDRVLSPMEALGISGLTASQLETLVLQTVWVAALLRFWLLDQALSLADGKLEWGLDGEGDLILVDAIGPDELRIVARPKSGASGKAVHVSKEFLRLQSRGSPWSEDLKAAQEVAKREGVSDWKRFVTSTPERLSPAALEVASQIYRVLSRVLTGREWFPGTWTVDQLVSRIEELS